MSAFDKTGVLFSNIILQQALRRIAEESASANIKKKKKKKKKPIRKGKSAYTPPLPT